MRAYVNEPKTKYNSKCTCQKPKPNNWNQNKHKNIKIQKTKKGQRNKGIICLF